MRSIENVMKLMKKIRRERGISISRVQKYLKDETGVKYSKKTIYGWEEYVASPNVMCFIALCRLFKISNIYALFYGGELGREEDIFDLIMMEELYKVYKEKNMLQEAVRVLLGLE